MMLISLLSYFGCSNSELGKIHSWTCFYNDVLPTGTPEYNLYIFDSTHHPELAPLKEKKAKVVGYISFGEVAKHDPFFEKIKNEKLLIDENENWPGSFRIDIKQRAWHDFIIKNLIPNVLAQGFDGIFIDTIDTAEYLENTKKMSGQIDGAIELIKSIRKTFPEMIIILNNGLFMTNMVGKEIDALLVEDIYTSYNFKDKTYHLAAADWTAERVVPVKAFQKKFKKPVLALDYLDKSDKAGIEKVASEARKQRFLPYISDIDLQTIFFHP